jgi:hypothetical protein
VRLVPKAKYQRTPDPPTQSPKTKMMKRMQYVEKVEELFTHKTSSFISDPLLPTNYEQLTPDYTGAQKLDQDEKELNKWVVKLAKGHDPYVIAEANGFENLGEVPNLANSYVFQLKVEFRSDRRKKEAKIKQLQNAEESKYKVVHFSQRM